MDREQMQEVQEVINGMRKIVKPYLAKQLKKINFEGCGNTDKAEFETDFEIVLTLAEQALAIPSAEPKAVLYSGDGYADGYMVYDMAECPNCGYEYDYGDKDWGLSFCPSCGQKLNWERSDKE